MSIPPMPPPGIGGWSCSSIGGPGRVAHQAAPTAAELRVDVQVRADAALLKRANQHVDAVAAGILDAGFLLDLGDEAGVADQEAHVREALRARPNVAALAVLVRLLPERQAFMQADHLDAEPARLLDEADADLVVEVDALPSSRHCVYVFHAQTPNCLLSRRRSSRLPGWFGFTRPWNISWWLPFMRSTMRRRKRRAGTSRCGWNRA